MIDLHCHILPNVDDGSYSLEQSIKIAQEAQEAGFSTICCTPHYLDNKYIIPSNKIHEILNNLQNEINKNGINIKLAIGNELYITEFVEDLIKNKEISTLNNSKYLLMELPMNYPVSILEDIIFTIQNLGLVPIIAHPERYAYVQKNPNMLINLIESGVLFQCNYGSIIGKYGDDAKKTIKILLEHNMVHFLGTDTHRDNSVFTYVNKCITELNKIIPPSNAEILTQINPKKVIDNEDISAPHPKEYKKKKWIFF